MQVDLLELLFWHMPDFDDEVKLQIVQLHIVVSNSIAH